MSESPSAGLPARRAALAMLSGVLQKRRPLDAGLDQLAGLAVRDAGFARALASETLRHMGALDAVLIAEATDAESVMAFAASIGSLGNIRSQTLRAFSAAEMNQILDKMPAGSFTTAK